jgi:hypothetical protein
MELGQGDQRGHRQSVGYREVKRGTVVVPVGFVPDFYCEVDANDEQDEQDEQDERDEGPDVQVIDHCHKKEE